MTNEIIQPSGKREYFFGKEWFDIRQITENVWAIREPYHFEDVLSYYVLGRDGAVLIDAGMGLADLKSVLPSPTEPSILLTHTHWDHMGSASEFPKVAVFNHLYETSRLQAGWRPNEIVGYTPENFTIPVPSNFLSETFSIPGVSQFSTLEDGQQINLGNITIKVIHTPGHTPGSTCFFLEELGYLFTGDTLYPGPEYLHMKESNPQEYFNSLEKLVRATERKLKLIFPGHNTYTSSPELLERHLLAVRNLLEPEIIREDVDEFGAYIEKKWSDFSFLLPKD